VKRVLFASQKEELTKALEQEVEQQMKCFASEDCGEGIRASSRSAYQNSRASNFNSDEAATSP